MTESSTIGDRCLTPDGPGLVVAREPFGNTPDRVRFGVKHDIYPPARVPGLYQNDVLYYFNWEVQHEQGK